MADWVSQLGADWIKAGAWDLPTDLGAFLSLLGATMPMTTSAEEAVAMFMELPAARAMPASLRASLVESGYLPSSSGRPSP